MLEESTKKTIKGKAVGYDGVGGVDVIRIVQREVRMPSVDEVRIEVKAAAVNPTDLLLRDPGFRAKLTQAPAAFLVPGMDAAGVVESVGPGVSRLHAGEPVMAVVQPWRPEGGAYAQHVVVPAASVVRIPDGVSFAQASTLPMNGLTAFLALELAALSSGQVLAVSGGAGLLARYTITTARRQGIRVVADAKRVETALVESLGAEIVVERGPDFAGAIREVLPQGVDALLDTAVLGDAALGALRDGGVYIPVRGWEDESSQRDIEVRPVWVHTVLGRTDWLEQLRSLVSAGQIELRVAGQYTPERTGDAQRALQAGGLPGRPVLTF